MSEEPQNKPLEQPAVSGSATLKKTLSKAYLIIEDKVNCDFAIVVNNGTMFNKQEVLADIKRELEQMGAL